MCLLCVICGLYSSDDVETRSTVSSGCNSSSGVREWTRKNATDGLAALGEIPLQH